MLARFTHPGIVRVYEVFEESGTAYLQMELLEGRTLFDHVLSRGGPAIGSPVPMPAELAPRPLPFA